MTLAPVVVSLRITEVRHPHPYFNFHREDFETKKVLVVDVGVGKSQAMDIQSMTSGLFQELKLAYQRQSPSVFTFETAEITEAKTLLGLFAQRCLTL